MSSCTGVFAVVVVVLVVVGRASPLFVRTAVQLVPLMNPDGVAEGHFRQDSYGNNLNRHYADPHPEKHASVYAAKAVVMYYAARPAGRQAKKRG